MNIFEMFYDWQNEREKSSMQFCSAEQEVLFFLTGTNCSAHFVKTKKGEMIEKGSFLQT